MERRKEVGRLDTENPKCKWHKTVYLEDGKLMKTIHDGSFTPVEPEPEMLPLYFDNLAINSHVGFVSTLETAPNFEWSWDRKEWHQWPYTTIDGVHRFDEKLLYSVGERLFIRGNNPNGLGAIVEGQETPNFTNFVIDGSVSAGGNIMSLLDKTMELTEVPRFGLMGLFSINGPGLESALITPPEMDTITAIGDNGCVSMYDSCTSLTSAAAMPALTTIGDRGCASMYAGCTSLTSAANMPLLTIIGDNGCDSMYYDCTSLTSAAAMPLLTTIGDNGCISMYASCTSLTSAADMPSLTTIGGNGCDNMYFDCTSLTSAADMPLLTTIGDNGCVSMYDSCTSLTSAADMPLLTTIGDYGCGSMFYGCTSLTSAAAMPLLTTIGDNGCVSMYSDCTFAMSDDGTTLNFAFPTPPVTAGATTLEYAYDVAGWMGNTNGFGEDEQ